MPADLRKGEDTEKSEGSRFKVETLHIGYGKHALCESKAIIWERKGQKERRTCEGDYNNNSEHVRVLCQYPRGFHGHVLSAKLLYALPYQLVEGSAPCTGHTGRTWHGERPGGVDFVMSFKMFCHQAVGPTKRKVQYIIVEHVYQWCRKGWGSIQWWRPRFPLQSHRSKDKPSLSWEHGLQTLHSTDQPTLRLKLLSGKTAQ